MLCKLEKDFFRRYGLTGAMDSSILRFLDHTQRLTTFGRTPEDEWSSRRRDLYLIIQNTHKRQTSMPPARFEPTVPASERSQTHVLELTTTGNGNWNMVGTKTMICVYTRVWKEAVMALRKAHFRP